MANVLPPESQHEVHAFYKTRFRTAAACSAILSALIGLTLLSPSYVSLLNMSAEPNIDVQGTKIDAVAERAEANRIHGILVSATSFFKSTKSPVDAIAQALSKTNDGITVTSISYSSQKTGTLVIIGMAATRDAINQFKNALEESNEYKSVSVPVNDLVGLRNSQFTMTLTGIN